MDIAAELKGKAGPFPLYVWLLLLTAAAAVYFVVARRKKGPGTGTPGTPCTMTDGSAGTWDSTGTVCQATTVSTVNAPGPDQGQPAQQAGGNITPPDVTPVASTPGNVGATVPPPPSPWPPAGGSVQPAHKQMVPHTEGLAAGEAHNLLVQAGFVPKAPAGQTATMKVSHTNPPAGTFQTPGIPVWIYTSGWVTSSNSKPPPKPKVTAKR